MLRKMICAGFVLAAAVGLAAADEFGALVTKVQDGKVTFQKFQKGAKKGEGTKGESTTLPTAPDVKVLSAKFNRESKKVEAGDALSDGLKNERFQNIGENGVFTHIVTDADGKTITEIRVMPKFGGKKKKDA